MSAAIPNQSQPLISGGADGVTNASPSIARTARIESLVQRWQEDQREFFSPTIVEIVSEYARWREDMAHSDDVVVMTREKLQKLILDAVEAGFANAPQPGRTRPA